MNKRLLVGRKCHGLGDWIMFTAVLKTVNNQAPDVLIDIIKYRHNIDDLVSLPLLCGVKCRIVNDGVSLDEYNWVIPHVVYRQQNYTSENITMFQNMLYTLCQATNFDLNIKYDATVRVKPLDVETAPIPVEPYIIVPSYAGSDEKNWSDILKLASLLSQHWAIVQVGKTGDPIIPEAKYKYFDLTFPKLSYIYRNAQFAVSFENGLSHWAGHHDVRSYTLYVSTKHANFNRAQYSTQTPILLYQKPISAYDVYMQIIKHERNKTNNVI